MTIRAPVDIRPVAPAELAAIADLCEAAYVPFVADDGEYVAALRDVARRAAEAEVSWPSTRVPEGCSGP